MIIIEKSGEVKSYTTKEFKLEELYKKCSFKTESNFSKQVEWNIGEFTYIVYGKKIGKSNSVNKYDFPPPIDTTTYYGNMVVLKTKKNSDNYEYLDLSVEEWDKVYEELFGGFEDLGSEGSESEWSSEEDQDGEEKTKNGYDKDGFVIDSEDDSELEYEEYK